MKKNPLTVIRLFITGVLLLLLIAGCKKKEDSITVTDIDGNVYKSVKIGNQVWFKENLKTTRFNDGADIPEVTDYDEWLNLTAPGFCWYENNESLYKDPYGALYNWYAVETGKLCPLGWHVPSDDEWQQLVMFLDPDAAPGFGESIYAGAKLKEKGTSHWPAPNEGATNETGFTALPGGIRLHYNDLNYCDKEFGFWWSSTEFSDPWSWNVDMGYNYSSLYRYKSYKTNGESVRCIKD